MEAKKVCKLTDVAASYATSSWASIASFKVKVLLAATALTAASTALGSIVDCGMETRMESAIGSPDGWFGLAFLAGGGLLVSLAANFLFFFLVTVLDLDMPPPVLGMTSLGEGAEVMVVCPDSLLGGCGGLSVLLLEELLVTLVDDMLPANNDGS